MGGFLERFLESKSNLRSLSERFDHWIVMYSGGKDSTALLVTAIEAALDLGTQRRVKMDVIYTDTLLEIPALHENTLRFIDFLRTFDRISALDIRYHITEPSTEESFWVCLLGKGYPPPHQRFRWCTKRLKVRPAEAVMKQIWSGSSAVLTGVRFDESKARDLRLLKSCSRGGECGQGLWMHRRRYQYIAPIIEWRECDVWDFLNFYAPSLGYPTDSLERIYNGRDTRFGCWVCTVVRQERALRRAAEQREELKYLVEFRDRLLRCREPQYREFRNGRYGRLKLSVRRDLLEELLELEERTGMRLISDEEVERIRGLWSCLNADENEGEEQ